MSDLEFLRDTTFDTDEDNNPFPEGGLATLLKSGDFEENSTISSQKPLHRNPTSNMRLSNDETDLNSPIGDENESTDENSDSLLLYRNQNTDADHIDHGTRVSRLLSPEKNVRILINEAGKSNEGLANASKKYIVYTIKLTDSQSDEIQTRRRYSDFESLREILTRVFPLVVIPPIPPKNYFSLNVLNGFVGSSPGVNGSNGPNGLATISGADSPPNNGPSYSYINSNYLNKSRLIEHRKRLLANFLNNCLLISQIRKLEFFAKFLDPSSNWSDEVSLITSQLPKSVYQLNPENGLSTDPIYASLPFPVSNHAISLPFLHSITSKFFSLKKTYVGSATNNVSDPQLSTQASSALAETSELQQNQESPLDISNRNNIQSSVVNKSQLDEINKRIMSNYIGLTSDYIELGAFLNSFSMVWADTAQVAYAKGSQENDTKLDLVFDRIGLAFDNSLSTINLLISELETKFSEPLGEAVKYTSVFESTKRFKAKKVKQSSLIELELKEKKKELADCLRAEIEVGKIQKGLQTHSLNKPSTYSLSASQHPVATEKSSKSRFLPSIGSMKKITKYVSDIMDQNPELTRKQRITQLQERIGVLEKCQKIMLQDIAYIADELSKNAEKFRKDELKSMFQILLNYNRIFILWAKRNVEVWEEAKEEIDRLNL